ncbi:SDR family NAD(P)-dependent oxidoreductase [Paenibacillus sp.]|jgi:polyketide synthase PksN|uniref:SDR family NAD(P)-dependent oxidoreductase n=1 Tax=Paenibacillus sp. TaxID=58172 RepID=UPI002818A7B7|nr:SDR family NAD(P)-dependent oxidoreductase [Paenibacillus sp.]MDR0270278.1 SDR family NAD(P)-dependent oxidoreductase [Paenibacillus sp.]
MMQIKNYIYSQVANRSLSQADAKQMLLELLEAEKPAIDDIAIIGMSGKFPMANNLDEYWSNIISGINCIRELPDERKEDIEQFLLRFHYDQLLAEDALLPDGRLKLNYDVRGYMDRIDQFDAAFFGIPPREAKAMDPDQRLFLEVAYESMEDAGYGGQKLYGSKTGVFVGLDHVSEMNYKKVAGSDPMVVTGTWPGILASRISYIFDFKGPSMVVDTACSSGLTSVHMACNALRQGECELAIAGGLSSFYYRPMKFKDELKELDSVESKDNIVRTFDKHAGGTVWGEGLGAVLLKPLRNALADGDVIHAVIKGSAINNDGASNGITAPDAGAQEELLLNVWKKANVNPETIQYIEAHGTGTVLGDPIEMKALTNAFRKYTGKNQFCAIGSVKTSIGHIVAASGIASLIKSVLMLKHRKIPESLHFTEPNPYINFCTTPFYVSDRLHEWEAGQTPRRLGINSFGFSGTNCHVILEEAPTSIEKPALRNSNYELFMLSAKNEDILRTYSQKVYDYLLSNEVKLEHFCYTLNTGRGHYNYRLALVVSDISDLKEQLKSYLSSDQAQEKVFQGVHRIVSDQKPTRLSGEITEGERRKLRSSAQAKLDDYMRNPSLQTAIHMCTLYVQGADINWDVLYENQNRLRISLPIYPLKKTRVWYEQNEVSKRPSLKGKSLSTKEMDYPLLDRCLVSSIYQDVYATSFSVVNHWVLRDHKVMGNHLIPGTTFIDMTRHLARTYFGDIPIQYNDVVFLAPVICAPEEIQEVQTVIIKGKNKLDFTITSKQDDGNWIKHAEGSITPSSLLKDTNIDVTSIISELNSEKQKMVLTSNDSPSFIELGERWNSDTIIAIGANKVLVELELPESVRSDSNDFELHPSLLDNAVNAVSQKVGSGLYLPFMYKKIHILGKMPKRFYSLISLKTDSANDSELITFNVHMFDPQGKVFAQVQEYKTKRVNVQSFERNLREREAHGMYQVGWVEEEKRSGPTTSSNGSTIVIRGAHLQSDQLISRLRERGEPLLEVKMADRYEKSGDVYEVSGSESDYRRLFGDVKIGSIRRIVHCLTLDDVKISDDLAGQQLAFHQGLKNLFHLTRALLAEKLEQDIDIVLITNLAWEVTGTESTINPHNAGFLTLGHIAGKEYRHLKVRAIDIDGNEMHDSLVDEVQFSNDSLLTAFRGERRFIQEMYPVTTKAHHPLPFSKNEGDGVYVITGGTGGLGLEMAGYVFEHGCRNIGLIARSLLPAREHWDEMIHSTEEGKWVRAIRRIRELEQKGAIVTFVAADVSDPVSLEKALNDLRKGFGRIAGVIHCAGVAGDGLMITRREEDFDQVVLPKWQGTWLLDRFTRHDDPDIFLLFSSILSHFPDYGQGDYAAANAYMDAFAQYRNRLGKRTVSVNWPAWKGTGMAHDYNVSEDGSTFNQLTATDAFRYLDLILQSDKVNVIPGLLNYDQLHSIEDELPFKLSEPIRRKLGKAKPDRNEYKAYGESKSEIMVTGRDGDAYSETEVLMAQIWSSVLGVSQIDVFESFSAMGGDSMMAIQLFKGIEEVFPGCIDISDIFTYPTIHQMVEYVDRQRNRVQIIEHEVATAAENEEGLSDEALRRVLESFESGEMSLENTLEKLK